MAQYRLHRWLGVALLALVMAGCTPSPQPFDRTAPQLETRPPALDNTYPYDLPAGRPREEGFFDLYSIPPSKIVKVGLLLPLTGRSAELGKALRDAAVMALFDKYSTMSGQEASIRVELVAKDTQGSPEGARQAAAEAVKEGVELILGPVFSPSVEAIKPLAAAANLPILSFSNNKEVAGQGVYIMGFDPAEQATRIARYAYLNDLNNIAMLVPADAYGRQVSGAFESVAKLLGRASRPIIKYSPAGGTLNQDIRTLAAEGTTGARFNFSGLFLPESGNKLGPILGGLSAMNITPQSIRFIGTGLWDDRTLIAQHDLDGAWLASSPPDHYEAFLARFNNTYSYTPPRIASLAYDGVALSAMLATSHQGFGKAALTNPNGFAGPANGIFRFRPDGSIERGLAVLEVEGRSGFKVLEPAPTSFR